MLLMIFLIVFCYDLLRNMKDAVVITTAGAEVIPFIKVALLPCAILITILFTKLTNRFSQEQVFYLMITGFLLFFAFFSFFIYPMRHGLHAHTMADKLVDHFPQGLHGLAAMVRYWSFTLFYVSAELWGNIVMTVLFWGFANEITRIGEAKRFYAVLCIVANCAAILSGQMAKVLPAGADNPDFAHLTREDWGTSLSILTCLIIVCGVLAMLIFRWMNKNVLNDPSFDDLHMTQKMKKDKGIKLSMKESFSYLSNSKYLLCIATLVLGYNLVINLVEVIWKDQLRRMYPAPDDYFAYMSNLISMVGVVSLIMAIFMARIIERFGWTKTAMITPIIMLTTSIGFFSFMFYQNYLGDYAVIMGATPLAIAVLFGAAQNCLSKGMKYSVFDTTKEMAFIPLSHECKLKGKAAIDGVGSRLGKSSGSLIHTGLLMSFGSLSASSPYVASILLIVIVLWILATRSLGKQFNELTDVKKEQRAKPIEPNASANAGLAT